MSEDPKKICVLYCGGQSFAQPAELSTGAFRSPTQDEVTVIVRGELGPVLKQHNVEITLDFFSDDLTGANQTPKDWEKLSQAIVNTYNDYDGFVVLHGANTIPYAASYLTFCLQNLGKSVIFSDKGASKLMMGFENARQQLLSAVLLAAHAGVPGVTVMSDGQLINGVDTIEYTADRYGSFVARNEKVLVTVGKKIVIHEENLRLPPEGDFFHAPMDPNLNIAVYQVTPASAPLPIYLADDPDGVVLIAYDNGSLDLGNPHTIQGLQQAKENRIPILVVTDSLHGNIDFDLTDARQQDAQGEYNLIPGDAMTIAAAMAKLRNLVSSQVPYEEMGEAMKQNMFGELDSTPTIVEIPGEPRVVASGRKLALS